MLGISPYDGELIAANSNAFILKTKTFLLAFYYIFRMHIKFGTFSKKVEPHSLIISEIIHSKKRGYLNT